MKTISIFLSILFLSINVFSQNEIQNLTPEQRVIFENCSSESSDLNGCYKMAIGLTGGCKPGEEAMRKADGGIACFPAETAIVQDPRGNKSHVAGDCGEAAEKAEKHCKGAEYAQYAPVVLNLAGALATQKSGGNIREACETAKKIHQISGVSNAAVAAMCQRAISNCKSVCSKDDTNGEEGLRICEDYETYAKAATGQAIQAATAMVGSQACADAVAGKCQGQAAYNDEDCTQFCLKPGRQDHPKCKIALNNCSNQAYAAQNLQYCTCMNNPFAPNCTNLGSIGGGNDPIPGSTPSPGSLDLDGGVPGGSEYDFMGNTDGGTPAQVNTPEGGGGGFDGGGTGSFGFGGSDGYASGDEPLDKDILTGTNGSGNAAATFGGGGYNESPGGGGYGGRGSGSKDDKGIDLRAFLPGGKKDPTRNPASAGYADPTITKANGLTNWQKITRKMNEKRPELMP